MQFPVGRTDGQQILKNDGFQVLQVKYDINSTVVRHLFMKQFSLLYHKNANADKPENRTLFVINIPLFVTEHHLRYLFEKRCGKIERIFMQERKPSLSTSTTAFNQIQMLSSGGEGVELNHPKPVDSVTKYFASACNEQTSKVCYLVFHKPTGVTNALDMASTSSVVYSLKPCNTDIQKDDLNEDDFLTGIRLWQKQYNDSIVAPWQAKKVADNFLRQYKEGAKTDASREKELADMSPDEDGWVTVNRKLRRDKQALVSNQFFDQRIKDKYNERARKRKTDETNFEESVSKSMLVTGKKKKMKGGKFNVDFMRDTDN